MYMYEVMGAHMGGGGCYGIWDLGFEGLTNLGFRGQNYLGFGISWLSCPHGSESNCTFRGIPLS